MAERDDDLANDDAAGGDVESDAEAVAKSIRLPRKPIDRIVGPLDRFLHVEAASGVVLLLATVIALALANSGLASGFLGFWKTPVGFTLGDVQVVHSLKHWINDGLMAIFFFVIGLEVKREIVLGELRDIKTASLPIVAALGGMIAPATLYLSRQLGQPAESGWGIPMATDIAFVVGCMAVLGSRIPRSLRVMLLSLAIADDIGAILVIAIGYTAEIHLLALALGAAGLGLVLAARLLGVRNIPVYVILGTLVWFAFHESGIHATIAGVILGLMTPSRSAVNEGVIGQILERATRVLRGDGWQSLDHRAEKVRKIQKVTREVISPLEYIETALHPWVGFVIMPLFALANAGVPFTFADIFDPVATAVMLGLVVGKPLGIVGFSFLAVRLRLATLPDTISYPALIGAGLLAGIGFTMALFIGELALSGEALDSAKVGILGGSLIAGLLGMITLVVALPKAGASVRSA